MPLYQFRRDNLEKTFLYIHVPKTGGTTIENFFRKIGLTGYFDPPTYMPVRPYLKIPPAHYDYGVLTRLFNLDALYSFAVVRHPVKRMISEYKWAVEKSTLARPASEMGFSGFIRHMFEEYKRDDNLMAGHFKPQIRFVGDKVSKIFKYEAGLEVIVKRVLEDVGLKIEGELRLPVSNKSTDRVVEPTAGDIELIRDMYADDFSAFGYTTEA